MTPDYELDIIFLYKLFYYFFGENVGDSPLIDSPFLGYDVELRAGFRVKWSGIRPQKIAEYALVRHFSRPLDSFDLVKTLHVL